MGALRGQRSLRDVYTGFAVGLPLVGAKIFSRDPRLADHPLLLRNHGSEYVDTPSGLWVEGWAGGWSSRRSIGEGWA